jgi:hypothetical protein
LVEIDGMVFSISPVQGRFVARATGYDLYYTRAMHRTTIQGDRPV